MLTCRRMDVCVVRLSGTCSCVFLMKSPQWKEKLTDRLGVQAAEALFALAALLHALLLAAEPRALAALHWVAQPATPLAAVMEAHAPRRGALRSGLPAAAMRVGAPRPVP